MIVKATPRLRVEQLLEGAARAEREAIDLKQLLHPEGIEWYRHSILGVFRYIALLLAGDYGDLSSFITGPVVADIGGADGDLSFFLERCGMDVDMIDKPETNMNGMRAVRFLKKELRSHINIYEMDLNQPFELPRQRYDLVFLLGTLYHLQNPYYVLEKLSWHAPYSLVSTRITQSGRNPEVRLENEPVAYLVDEDELNQDATNYWIFSQAGLRRLISRTGWVVCGLEAYGNTERSDPISTENDERAICLLKSRNLTPTEFLGGWEPAHAKNARWMREESETRLISGEQGRLVVRGYVPREVFERCYGGKTKLTVRVNDDEMASHEIERSGEFSLAIPVTDRKRLLVHMKIDRSFVPDDFDGSGDTRRLAAVFTEVEAY